LLFVLQAAIKRFVAQTNHTPKPFVWTQIPAISNRAPPRRSDLHPVLPNILRNDLFRSANPMPYLTVTREAHDLIYRCCLRERDWADSSKEVDGGMLVEVEDDVLAAIEAARLPDETVSAAIIRLARDYLGLPMS